MENLKKTFLYLLLWFLPSLVLGYSTFAKTGIPNPEPMKPVVSQALRQAGRQLTHRLAIGTAQGRDYDFRYIEVGGGAAIWQTSHEPRMENQRNALHFFAEYGDLQKPLSVAGGVNFRSAYLQQGYQLEPRYYFAHAKYTPTRLIYEWPVWFNLYAIGGPVYWQASLTNTNVAGLGNQENLTEKDAGLGFLLGTGASLDVLNFSLSLQWNYFWGKGQFEAGALEPQDVYTGSAQVVILLSYRFFLSGSLWKCPTYK